MSKNLELDKIDKERQKVRAWIEEQMQDGKLSSEPELESITSDGTFIQGAIDSTAAKWDPSVKRPSKTGVKGVHSDTEYDDFFGSDSDDGVNGSASASENNDLE